MIKTVLHIFLAFLLSLSFLPLQAQDTTQRTAFLHNIFNRVISSVTVSNKDSANQAIVLKSKSSKSYTDYEGKIIRNIDIKNLGFEKVFTDTSQVIKYYGTRLLNHLHTDSYGWVIEDNLFIRSGTKLNPLLVADNERHLRSLEFIQDARIIVKPIRGNKDSIDLEVITKDLFSITGSLNISSKDKQRLQLAEKNLAGGGQKIQLTTLRDKRRNPVFGYDFLYTKNSVLHSFVNASAGFTKIEADRQGDRGVTSFYLQFDRPLVSAYSRTAGGFLLRFNRSLNAFKKPDSLFYNFKDSYVDLWGGYNFGVDGLLQDHKSLNRTFAALRLFQDKFNKTPFQIGNAFDPFFNNRKALLGELTFFRQQFYKTNFIYGFGTTEDIPYGYNIALTGGWYKQLKLLRPYMGINANYYLVTPRGKFIQSFVRVGGFSNKGRMEDIGLLVGGNWYSKLYVFPNTKLREYLKFSYTRLFNRVTSEPLRINNALGLQYFSSDSSEGTQRMSVYAETSLFLKYKLFGFQMAPFAFADFSLLTGEKRRLFTSGFYTGMGGGMRTRNENLIFGTIELRFDFFPRRVADMTPFRLSFKSNLRFRYNSTYVKAPNFILLNDDDANNVY